MSNLSKETAGERLSKLKELINEYRYQYNVHNKSIMSEEAADSLKHELTQIEEQYPDLITEDSPSQRVAGEPLDSFKSVEHKYRMLSLNDVFNESELEGWINRITKLVPENHKIEYFMDIKMDGLAASLIYVDGKLQTAITRGDGFVGEDVTKNIRTIESVPLSLRKNEKTEQFSEGRTEVRGEVVMYKADFAELNKTREESGLPLFANPRNTAAGTIRQLDPALVSKRKLHFRAYDLIRDNKQDVPFHSFAYKALIELGFLANDDPIVANNANEILQNAKEWETKRHDLAFNTDGLVIKVNDRSLYERLGVVGKAPRGAVAYKYAAEQSTTKVKDIFISIGRTGAATPVAVLEPVVIAGSTVQMATLHNEGEIFRKDIRIGDTVIVHKAGDIIPEVVEPLKQLRTGDERVFNMPDLCPECSTKLVKTTEKEAVWRCPNNLCPSRVLKRIQHFASKAALDIEGLGEKNVESLLEAGLIKDIPDIYELTVKELKELDRFADVSANKLIKAIASKKNPPLGKFIYGLGIRQIGAQTALDLANHFKRLDNLGSSKYEELKEIDGIGEVVAESILAWFADDENQRILAKLRKLGVWPQEVKRTGGKLDGIKFVITGSLESMSRESAADKIRSMGGTFQSSIGKDTNYLVVGDTANKGKNTTKLLKAEKAGVKIINEKTLLDLLS